jgi:hypothetical protein
MWGQRCKVYTDPKNMIHDVLGLTLDHVFWDWWRFLLKEYGPEIMYIEYIHETGADTFSWLDFGPVKDDKGYMDDVYEMLV